MAVINTNVKALFSQAALKGTERAQATAMQQLSTGKRINSAKDDAAGMAIATRMTQQIRALNQAVRNAGDAVSLLQTVEGATGSITDMMQRMRELAVQAINDTNADDQRSYLDLEFQQLKQEIVRVADMTEWNDFPVLNGSAGERVGEMPVFKATSVSDFGTVFIDPTTMRTISGADAGEKQTLTLTGTPATGTISVAGVDVEILAADAVSLTTFAAKIQTSLKNSEKFSENSGRTISAAAGVLTITYAATDGNVDDTPVSVGATGVTSAIATTRNALTQTTESLTGNAKFLKSGALTIDVSTAGAVTASFLTADSQTVKMTGTLNAAAGTITFDSDTGNNGQVISDDVVYTMKNSAGTAESLSSRATSLTVDVSGSIPALRTGDLRINGVDIGASYPADDLLSPVNNASGSAIAKAAAINRKSAETGVVAKVNQNILTGQAMTGTAVVKGAVFINGYASADITTVLNNTRETRTNVANAINAISNLTGVKAIDTGSDTKGISLVAADGRNIEVRFETTANANVFGATTGLTEGVHSGTYGLESKIPNPVVISAAATGDITRAGLIVGDFSKNQSVVMSDTRAIVSADKSQVNTVTIAGTVATGDTYSATINGKTYTATVGATQTAQAARDLLITAINTASPAAEVTAAAGNAVGELSLTANMAGTPFTLVTSKSSTAGTVNSINVVPNTQADYKPLNAGDLVINGVAIRATTTSDDTKSNNIASSSNRSASAIALAAAINSATAQTGVRAEANAVISAGAKTETAYPVSDTYSLFVNGVEVEVEFEQDETGSARRAKVVDAINARTGQHGITAEDNGNGVTMSSDGRNVSVWFDSNVKDLSAASFGLDKGGSVAQVSRVTVGGTVATGDKATVVINGVTIQSAVTTAATTADMATKLEAAINAALSAGTIKNVSVKLSGSDLTITSSVAGSPFELKGAAVTPAGSTLSLGTVTANSMGKNDVTAIRGATASSTTANTLYGTVRMISDPALLPKLPSPTGAPPAGQQAWVSATGEPFTVSAGVKGFGADGNFAALGFQEGSFGGKSDVSMEPPRVGRLAFQVGGSANQLITIDLADFGKNGPITGEITGDVDKNVEVMTNRINTRQGATDILAKLDSAMDKVNANRANLGAVMNRLTYAMENLTNVSTNTSASRSQIEDADYAAASTELSRTQIMQQAATAVLAQANTSQQTVLKLLQG